MAGSRHHRKGTRHRPGLIPASGEWHYKQLKFIGTSIAGIRTSIAIPELDVCFDVAQGLPFAVSYNRFLITHGHMDHAAGIPYLISQKAMNRHKKPTFYMPPSLVQPMHDIIQIWQKIENHCYEYDLIGVEIGKEYELSKEWSFRPFQTVHRVESNGYTLYRRRKQLKPGYKDLAPHEIVALRREKMDVEQWFSEPIVSFTGDTQIEFLLGNEDVKRSEVLLTEVTYVDEKKTVAAAREWGHLHLDELIPLLAQLQNKKIVMIHLSTRYTHAYVASLLDQRIPPELRDKIEIFPSV